MVVVVAQGLIRLFTVDDPSMYVYDAQSCLTGFIAGLAMPFWIMIGAIINEATHDHLQIYTFGCESANCTTEPYLTTQQWLVTTLVEDAG